MAGKDIIISGLHAFKTNSLKYHLEAVGTAYSFRFRKSDGLLLKNYHLFLESVSFAALYPSNMASLPL